ncbi:hypothetical protein KGM_201592 [Danaus plexippus plexippus]|uniref:Uncharacterized protein n=1 Tax=Danaus plexippus plexippus TaxID=278856 RepID=A0A212EQ46_DANPL|nr:hypothetical protein KGM_201592 [Danaus plexippus plexippus]
MDMDMDMVHRAHTARRAHMVRKDMGSDTVHRGHKVRMARKVRKVHKDHKAHMVHKVHTVHTVRKDKDTDRVRRGHTGRTARMARMVRKARMDRMGHRGHTGHRGSHMSFLFLGLCQRSSALAVYCHHSRALTARRTSRTPLLSAPLQRTSMHIILVAVPPDADAIRRTKVNYRGRVL